ncbi:heat shock protein 9/12-domain-containing protein [Suillus occidentalis]|nr:heat shock protein 9/12-domain-containing protein [Suillus occidentalis]
MADTGRQSMTDKAASSMKPESQKSMTEQAGDKTKGMADSVASTMQPQSEKSATQKAGDTVSGNSNEGQESLMEKAKQTMGMGGAENK